MSIKKSQSALEFTALVGVGMMFTVLVSYGIYSQMAKFQDQKKHEFVRDVALKIRAEILLAANSQPGYERDFEILPTGTANIGPYCARIHESGTGFYVLVWLRVNDCDNDYGPPANIGEYSYSFQIPEMMYDDQMPPEYDAYFTLGPQRNNIKKCQTDEKIHLNDDDCSI